MRDVLIGGGITLVVAIVVFWIQERRARRSFGVMAQFLESLAANRGGSANVEFTRDAKGQIIGAQVSVSPMTGELPLEGTVSGERRTNSGQTEGEVS